MLLDTSSFSVAVSSDFLESVSATENSFRAAVMMSSGVPWTGDVVADTIPAAGATVGSGFSSATACLLVLAENLPAKKDATERRRATVTRAGMLMEISWIFVKGSRRTFTRDENVRSSFS